MNTYWEKRFIELLHKSPKTKLEVEEMEYAGDKFSEELQSETEDLLNEIERNGLKVNKLWDLVNTKDSYPEAIEILTEHLKKPYHIKNKEGIIRALGVKEAGLKTLKALLAQYPNVENDSMRFAVVNSVYNIIKGNTPKKLMAETNESDILIKELIQLFIDNKKLHIVTFNKFFEEDFAEKLTNKQNIDN